MSRIAYKLFRERKDGSITSLFINKTRTLQYYEWMDAENFPTKGFAERPGWHCTAEPVAPHLKMKLKSGEVRVWKKIMMEDFTEFKRPENQGGLWFLAKRMMIVDDNVSELFCNQLKHIAGDAKIVVESFDKIKFPVIRRVFGKSIWDEND